MNSTLQLGLLALILLSALGAGGIALLIARRSDLPLLARRAFLLSNVSLVLCLACCVGGISFSPTHRALAFTLGGLAVAFLILKFIFVRQFAHLIRRSQPTAKSAARITQPKQV